MRMLIAVLAAMTALGTTAYAQQKAPTEASAFAKKVASANTFEIQSSELANDRAKSDDVKSFAQQMITDHTKIGQDFESAVKAANVSPPKEPDAKQKAILARLRRAKGAAFDEAYVSAQLAAHKEAVSLFRSYSKTGHAAPLKAFAQRTLPTLERHLSMAQELSRSSTVAARQSPRGTGGAAIGPPAESSRSGKK